MEGETEGRLAHITYKNAFIRGLQPAIRDKVYMFEPADLESAITKAIHISGAESIVMDTSAPEGTGYEKRVRFEAEPRFSPRPVEERPRYDRERPPSRPNHSGNRDWQRDDRRDERPRPFMRPTPTGRVGLLHVTGLPAM